MELLGQRLGLADLLGPPFGDADVERLAGPDDVRERLHRLLERRLVVVAVRLVQVDVVELQPAQRGVDALADVLAREPDLVGALPHRPVDLGEDLEPGAGLTLQRPSEDLLGATACVDVGGVERRDAAVESRVHAGLRGVLLDLAAVGDPVAVGQLADLEPTATEKAVIHALTLARVPLGRSPTRKVSFAVTERLDRSHQGRGPFRRRLGTDGRRTSGLLEGGVHATEDRGTAGRAALVLGRRTVPGSGRRAVDVRGRPADDRPAEPGTRLPGPRCRPGDGPAPVHTASRAPPPRPRPDRHSDRQRHDDLRDGRRGGRRPGPGRLLDYEAPLTGDQNMVHVVCSPTGKCLFVVGKGKKFSSYVYNPTTKTKVLVKTPDDLFCAGHVLLPDGRALVVGGTLGRARGGAPGPSTSSTSSPRPTRSCPTWPSAAGTPRSSRCRTGGS